MRDAYNTMASFWMPFTANPAKKHGLSQSRLASIVQRIAQFGAVDTPPATVERLLDNLTFKRDARVLEPSAGKGAICKPLLARGAAVDAVEAHPSRAAALRGLRHPALSVRSTNFLKLPPAAIYDLVLMNPPRIGTQWMEHVQHAFEFLAPNGELRAILPASAEYGATKKHETFRAWASNHAPLGLWRDMPPAHFAWGGIRINTLVLTLTK